MSGDRVLSITHVITGLEIGGAEMMLYKLLSHTDRNCFASDVISLTELGPVGEKIQALGYTVHALEMKRGIPDLKSLWRLTRLLRRQRPDVIQTWMYHSDLIGGIAARLAGVRAVAWGIRQSNLDRQNHRRTTLWTAKACALLSRILPARIVCCSESARISHQAFGYSGRKMRVIPNGFDLNAFRPDSAARISVHEELDLPVESRLIGLVGRFDPQKDHHNFVQAAERLHAQHPDVHFLLCGGEIEWSNETLGGWIKQAGMESRFHLLGRRSDTPRLTAAMDIASLSSLGEGFPNVVGEAMACGVVCAVTDVGDAAYLVGDTGRIAPARNPEALANAWHELLMLTEEERQRLGASARERVQQLFSLPAIVAQYEALYREMRTHVRPDRLSTTLPR